MRVGKQTASGLTCSNGDSFQPHPHRAAKPGFSALTRCHGTPPKMAYREQSLSYLFCATLQSFSLRKAQGAERGFPRIPVWTQCARLAGWRHLRSPGDGKMETEIVQLKAWNEELKLRA